MVDFDAANKGIISGAVRESDDDLAATVGRRRKRAADSHLVPRRGKDIEVREHLGTVDAHIEGARPNRLPRQFRPVQYHRVRCAGRQASNGVGERCSPAAGLIHRLWRWIAIQARGGVDPRRSVAIFIAARAEIHIGTVTANSGGTARVNRHHQLLWRRSRRWRWGWRALRSKHLDAANKAEQLRQVLIEVKMVPSPRKIAYDDVPWFGAASSRPCLASGLPNRTNN
jgi:hypothetical protein